MEIYQNLELFFLFLTAIATTVYAIITWKMVQPLISVMMVPDEFDNLSMNLMIENVGSGTAYDVKFKASPDFQIIPNRFLSQIGLFKTGLQSFQSHIKLKIHLTWMPSDYETKIKNPFEIEVKYKDRIGLNYHETYLIDLFLYGEVPLSENPLAKIAKSLENIEKQFVPTISHHDKIKVVCYTKEESEKEILERHGLVHRPNYTDTKE